MAKQTKAEKLLDKEIDRIYRENCANIEIDIMDIGKIFAEGKKAHAEGRDIKEAVITFVETIRKN